MWLAEITLLGLALSMDAFAVTIANAFAYPKSPRNRSYLAPIAFGVFQGIMPTIGYFIGSYATGIIMAYQGIVTLVILGFIGGKMVYDGIREMRSPGSEEENASHTQTIHSIVFQAFATSIDALAVGVTFAGSSMPIGVVAILIALTTLATCTIAWIIGRRFGLLLGARAEVIGGAVLIAIGIRAMFF